MQTMRAIEMFAPAGLKGLRLAEVERPRPAAGQVLIEVRAAGLNFAELEMLEGRYPAPRPLPQVMGFEAAGVVVEVGPGVEGVRPGARVAAIAANGGMAEYAVADAVALLPVPEEISFAQAVTLPVQGVTAHALLRLAARVQPGESVLVQAAAGGVGVFLVQLAKRFGARPVIALVGSERKAELVRELGADLALNYCEDGWAEQVRAATGGRGVDVLLECVSGAVADACFPLVAPFGRVVLFGAKNIHDTLPPAKLRQLVHGNQAVVGFNLPTVPPERIAAQVPSLLALVRQGRLRLLAEQVFALEDYDQAFGALAGGGTVGKVVLAPALGK